MRAQSRKFIHVGQIHVDRAPFVISTVLGSCVAVCLYDPVQRIGAMNHYLLPFWNSNGLQSPRYGNLSIPKMIEMFRASGGNLYTTQAKILGGASMAVENASSMMIGEKNVVVAREILHDYKITVAAEDVGGTQGRRVQFDLDSGKIRLRYTSYKDMCHVD